MEVNICKARKHLRKYGFKYGDSDAVLEYNMETAEILSKLNELWTELPIEGVEIHHFGNDYVRCPALAKFPKLFPTKDLYDGIYGCTGCCYHDSIGLRHVRCKWRSGILVIA